MNQLRNNAMDNQYLEYSQDPIPLIANSKKLLKKSGGKWQEMAVILRSPWMVKVTAIFINIL